MTALLQTKTAAPPLLLLSPKIVSSSCLDTSPPTTAARSFHTAAAAVNHQQQQQRRRRSSTKLNTTSLCVHSRGQQQHQHTAAVVGHDTASQHPDHGHARHRCVFRQQRSLPLLLVLPAAEQGAIPVVSHLTATAATASGSSPPVQLAVWQQVQ